MEELLGAESEEELAAFLSQLQTWQEGGEGPWCSYHDPYADPSFFDTWPSLPMDQKGSRRPVMKRKVLRHRPDGTVEVSHESPNTKPWSLRRSRASMGDPISKTETSSNTLENNLQHDDGNRLRENSLCSLLGDFGNNISSNYAMFRQQAKNYIAPKAPRVKRTDPVTKLNKYKQDWKRFSFPGQDPHENLRRAVHRQILQTGLPRREQRRVSVPNPYEVPTMKKRDSLRFGVRWDLAHRRIPRRNATC